MHNRINPALKLLKWTKEGAHTHTAITVVGKFSITQTGDGKFVLSDWPSVANQWVKDKFRSQPHGKLENAKFAAQLVFQDVIGSVYE